MTTAAELDFLSQSRHRITEKNHVFPALFNHMQNQAQGSFFANAR
jgi:hypothetical protein